MASILNTRTIVGTIVDVFPVRTVGKDDTSVVSFTVAITPSVKTDDGWENGETEFVRVDAWRKLAENIAATFNKGDRVLVIGRQTMEPEREDKEGNTIPPRPKVTADHVGLELSYDAAASERKANKKTTAQSEDSDEDEAPRKSSSKSKKKDKPAPAKRSKAVDPFEDDEDDIFGSKLSPVDDDDEDDFF